MGAYYRHTDKELGILGTSMARIEAGSQPIAKCECAVLPTALYQHAEHFRNRDVLWMVDNTAALHGVVKGTARDEFTDRLANHFWMAAFRLQCRVWLEYIDSKGNWSDGISREFEKDVFVAKHHVQVRELHDPFSWYHSDIRRAWIESKSLVHAPAN